MSSDTLLKADETFISVPSKYVDFVNVFSKDLAAKLLEYTKINNHAIDLVKYQQPPYRPIYYLELVELETLKIYIETNLANSFIRPSKSPTSTFILFVKKFNSSLQLFVNYQDLNNLIIKN